jgi:MFS family permease
LLPDTAVIVEVDTTAVDALDRIGERRARQELSHAPVSRAVRAEVPTLTSCRDCLFRSAICSQVTDRFERKWLLVGIGSVIAISGLFYGLTFDPIMIVFFGFLVNFFERGYTAVAYAYSPEVFDIRARSLGTSFSYGLGRLSNAIGPLVIAALYTGSGYHAVFFFIAGTWLFGAIVLALFGASTRKVRLAHPPVKTPLPASKD